MKIETNPSVSDFFRNTIKSILKNRQLEIDETTEFYVVNLLTTASQSQADESLAILFGKAFSSKDKEERYSLLKQLGDQSLFISGFFGDSLKRKLVDIDYYISMGSNAYSELSEISKQQNAVDVFSKTFDEMAINFMLFVDLFSEISERAKVTSNQDLLRLYERWIFTKSQRLLEKLQELGIHPKELKKEVH